MVKIIGFTIIFLIYFIVDGFIKQKRKKDQYKLPANIKDNYKELKVPANKIEILTNKYLEEVETSRSIEYKAAEALYDNNRNFTKELKYASTLVYYEFRGGKKTRLHSETIAMSEQELRSIINSKGSVSIFIDNNHTNNYYFDLSFLAD